MMLEKMKPYFAVIFLQFGNAGLVIIAKAALNHGMNHYTFAVYRNLIATLVITPFALFFESKGRPKLTISIFFKIMLLGFLEPVVDQNLYYAGMKYTTATFAVAMCNIIPAMTFVLAWICRLEKVNIKKIHSMGKIVGTLVTVGGAMIMTVVAGPTIGLPWTKGSTTDHQQQSTTPPVSPADNIKGSMMIIAGCVSWSFFYIVQAITLRSYPAELSLTALICAAGTMQGSIVTIIAERGNNEAWRLHLDAGLVTMVYGGVICSGLGYYLSGIIMKEKGPVFVTAFNPLSMVIVAVLGSIVLSEQMNLGRVLGAAVIVIGLYLVIWGKSKDESQSNSKCDPDQLPPVNQQQIPMTISSTKLAKEDQDSLSIAIPPTNETVVKINGK
ncbi:WAT1-related protein At2g39510-like [Cynara cardunculus var. scolymus]|uniref:WAT1-related protein At2g39510-like n=1 Tax=Cynara cardunculus var. scolymus TaxID=59895 RepID=UPI000D625554|nr:WAT1-related protein At2g39510-like [Cynara cardunculus var. scolymus]